jgi:hypothetical protein
VNTIRNLEEQNVERLRQNKRFVRKRAFGVLQSRRVIVQHPEKTWSVETLWEVMTACMIMHSIIVKDPRDDSLFDQRWKF